MHLFLKFSLIGLFLYSGCSNQSTTKTLEIEMSQLQRKEVSGTNLAFYENQPFSGKVYSYYPNGNKHIKQTYSQGKKEGEWTIWYEDGNMQKLGYVTNGLEDSVYREWYPNGQMRYEYHYESGARTGRWDTWYDSGVKWTEREFSNGKLNGKVKVFDTDGTQTKDYTYRNGQLIAKKDLRADENTGNQSP